eukprot:GHVS01005623.1.p1 GENE.GHVS01005623.1~~GHVS01005623.1.p1  ORF type:complete len:220 (+),score=22.14 GHVS01005623.1:58-717(+)
MWLLFGRSPAVALVVLFALITVLSQLTPTAAPPTKEIFTPCEELVRNQFRQNVFNVGAKTQHRVELCDNTLGTTLYYKSKKYIINMGFKPGTERAGPAECQLRRPDEPLASGQKGFLLPSGVVFLGDKKAVFPFSTDNFVLVLLLVERSNKFEIQQVATVVYTTAELTKTKKEDDLKKILAEMIALMWLSSVELSLVNALNQAIKDTSSVSNDYMAHEV